MNGRTAILTLIICLVLPGSTSCGVLFPTSKVTYVGHSSADVLSAVEEGNVRSVQVHTPANGGAPFALSIDLKDGDHWGLKEQIGDVLAAVESFNARAAKVDQITVKEVKSYNWSTPGPPGPSPTSVCRAP